MKDEGEVNTKYHSRGHIFKCVKPVACRKSTLSDNSKERKVYIEEGELVEFRYQSHCNFRTHDEIYCHLKDYIFNEHFEIVGKVWRDVMFNNRTKLLAIIDNELYDKIKY